MNIHHSWPWYQNYRNVHFKDITDVSIENLTFSGHHKVWKLAHIFLFFTTLSDQRTPALHELGVNRWVQQGGTLYQTQWEKWDDDFQSKWPCSSCLQELNLLDCCQSHGYSERKWINITDAQAAADGNAALMHYTRCNFAPTLDDSSDDTQSRPEFKMWSQKPLFVYMCLFPRLDHLIIWHDDTTLYVLGTCHIYKGLSPTWGWHHTHWMSTVCLLALKERGCLCGSRKCKLKLQWAGSWLTVECISLKCRGCGWLLPQTSSSPPDTNRVTLEIELPISDTPLQDWWGGRGR